MELTATQLQYIGVMRRKARACLAQHRAWTEGNYKNYAFASAKARLEEGVKTAFKAIINEWLEANSLTAFIRSELRVRYYPYSAYTNYQIRLGATSIYNGKGGLPDGKNRWLNKVTVSMHQGMTRLAAHVARTDPDFLEPTASNFLALIEAIHDALSS